MCQARGGHLAGASAAEHLSIIYQLCTSALRSLPGPSRGGFTSHDLPSGCWVGLFCPTGWTTDGLVAGGFGATAWKRLASLQPDKWIGRNVNSILPGPGSTCSASEDLVWLGGRSTTDGTDQAVAGSIEAAAGGLSLSTRCAAVFPVDGATGNGTAGGQLGMAACQSFAAFVCERPAINISSSKGNNTSPMAAAAAAAASTSIGTVVVRLTNASVRALAAGLPDTVHYMGCYAMTARLSGGSGPGGAMAGLASSPAPLPVLLSAAVDTYEACYSLAAAFNLSYFALSSEADCWGGWEPPSTPFVNMTDDAVCRVVCTAEVPSTGTATTPPLPGCMASKYSTVFSVGNGAADNQAPPTTATTPYVCMSEQLLSVPNATLVGQLHVSRSQLPRCEAICSHLTACDMFVYDTRSLACVLLGLPYVARLADLALRDVVWARDTCVKAQRILEGAELLEMPISDPAAVVETAATDAAYLCSPQLSSMAYTANPTWSPSHQKPVPDPGACSQSCFFNASCHGFVVRQQALPEGGMQYVCTTYGSITKGRTEAWMAWRPWVLLPAIMSPSTADNSNGTANGCLMLERLAPPPPYVCSDHVDVGGWELQRLDGVDEQACRTACDLDEQCSLYVVQEVPGSPPSCSVRCVWQAAACGLLGLCSLRVRTCMG